MVKVILELSKLEIQMLYNCIEAAIDTKHVQEQDAERAGKILKKLSSYL